MRDSGTTYSGLVTRDNTSEARLQMASPLGAKGSVSIANGTGSSITIHIEEAAGVSANGLSFSTWGAAFALSNVLHTLEPPSSFARTPKDPNAFNVLELGAGTGLVGIAAAALWKQNALLTDLPSILPGLAANIRLNNTLLKPLGVSVSCGSLDWTSPSAIHLLNESEPTICHPESKFSTILAADTLYDPEHAPLMADTISTWLSPGPAARAVLCYALRFAYIDCIREFWELMEAKGLHCVNEGRVMGGEEWNEVPGTEFEWTVWEWKDSSVTT